jgi:hypothetical protein
LRQPPGFGGKKHTVMKFTEKILEEINCFSEQLEVGQSNGRVHFNDLQMNAGVSIPLDADFDYDHRGQFTDLDFDNYSISIYKTHFSIYLQ